MIMSKIICKPYAVAVSVGICTFSLALMLGSATRVYAVEPQATDLLKKMNALYMANTYQGTALLTQKGTTEDNKPYLVKGTEEVSFKSPNIYAIKSSGSALGGTQVRIFDGKQMINYNSAQKQYMKHPMQAAGGGNAPLPLLSLFGISVDVQNGKLVGSAAVGGRAAYLVQTNIPMPALRPGATAQEKASREEFKRSLPPLELAIDKKDFRLLRMTQTFKEPKMTRTLEFTQQTFNPTLDASVFAFTPPSGTKSQETAMQALLKNGLIGSQGQQTKTSKGGGNPLPVPHASPGAGGANLHP